MLTHYAMTASDYFIHKTEILHFGSNKMPKTQQRSIRPQATSAKRLRRSQVVPVAAKAQEVVVAHQPARRLRKTAKQAQPSFVQDEMNVSRPRPMFNHATSRARRARSSSTPSLDSVVQPRLTKTGRISKAEKGLPVHHCDKCIKVSTASGAASAFRTMVNIKHRHTLVPNT